MSVDLQSFPESFACLTGHSPMRWQHRLFDLLREGKFPAALDLPTGLGKTSVMAIWLLARAFAEKDALKAIPRRLVYIVDRRAVVDQATEEAVKLRDALEGHAGHLKERLGLDGVTLPISTLRGAHVDNRAWLADPAAPAIIVGTVDMIGSRLLFEGYGISRKMRPYHAGLLGADALIVLDEAHLVPPFAHLLRKIEGDAELWPKDRTPLPPFIVLPLSATQRDLPGKDGLKPFGLEGEDWRDEAAAPRLNARKQLRIEALAEKDHDRQVAETALALATNERPARVVVFCSRREKKDDGSGPSVQGVAEAIEALARGEKKAGREMIDIEPPELLVGARRVYERQQVAQTLRRLGFIDGAEAPGRPAFLVATSAGEVGVDLDADHMVCDLVPWERMVQRLGRANRRGGEGRVAKVIVFDTSGIAKDEDQKARLFATRDLLKRLEADFGGEAGPATLLKLRGLVNAEEIKKASTAEPLRPALTRALVDAWSMTSLARHTGRPEIAPWLRGWVEEESRTTVVWRKFLPLRVGEDRPASFSSEKETNEFFDAAPPHEGEKLETETYRVADWLHDRATELLAPKKIEAQASLPDRFEGSEWMPQRTEALQSEDVVLLALSPAAEYERHWTLGDLAQDRKAKAKDEFHDALAEKILVVDARFGGLKDGMLDSKGDDSFPTADSFVGWSKEAGFRVRRATSDDYDGRETDWRFEDDFVLRVDGDGDPTEWLIIEHFRNAAQSEEARSISWPQQLSDHQDLAEQKARRLGEAVGLVDIAVEALALAAAVHDEGKRASRWQRAFKAPRDARQCKLSGPLAKTRGPIDHAILDGYRHEFGSLAVFEPGHEAARRLPADIRQRIETLTEDWRDLVLHLIAAHHGQARPVIETRSCEDAPPSALEGRARDVALRFARLQKRWGPWGLAWWEALLRTADQQASRDDAGKQETVAQMEKA